MLRMQIDMQLFERVVQSLHYINNESQAFWESTQETKKDIVTVNLYLEYTVFYKLFTKAENAFASRPDNYLGLC